MKALKNYIHENVISESVKTRKEIEEKCPKFWSAVSQFCRDKNSEEGIEWIIAAWTCDNEKEWQKYEKDKPFSSQEIHEFEEKYLTDEAIEEIEKLK